MTATRLSVVIPVSRDLRLSECLKSIDEPVEVIIVLNNFPSLGVKNIVNDFCWKDLKVVNLDGGHNNLSVAFNAGIKAASNEKILIMNSDCIFKKGQLGRISNLLNAHDVVKMRIKFSYRSFSEQIVSRTRTLFHEYYNDGKNIFGPGLGFKKSVRAELNGYFYDEEIAWGEDGELTKRINRSNLKLYKVKSQIVHAPETMKHDLLTALKIGAGKRAADRKLQCGKIKGVVSILAENLFDHKGHFKIAYRTFGITIWSYLVVWKMAFTLGYIRQVIKSG